MFAREYEQALRRTRMAKRLIQSKFVVTRTLLAQRLDAKI